MSANPAEKTMIAVPVEKMPIPSSNTVLRGNRARRYPVGTPAMAKPKVNNHVRSHVSASEKPYCSRTSCARSGTPHDDIHFRLGHGRAADRVPPRAVSAEDRVATGDRHLL